jgi:ABC-type sugar transport system substrate-binding protein
MKRSIAAILSVLMVLSLLASCASSPAANSAPPVSAASPDAPAPAAPEANTSEPSSTPAEQVVPPLPAGTVGFYSDDVDWAARKPYKIAYITYGMMFLHELLSQAFEEWSHRVNFEYTLYDSGSDMSNMLSTMETYASLGYDGFLLDPDAVVADRTAELAEELGIAYLPVLTPFMDSNNEHRIAPGVDLDGYNLGKKQTDWLVEHYTEYWPDVKPDEIGYLFMFASFNENLIFNMEGSRDRYKEIWPELGASNFYEGDLLAYEVSADAGYDFANTFITSHPTVKYWFISTCLEDYAQGAARAVEGLGIDSNVLILSNGINLLMQDWVNGYEGCWVSGVYYAQSIFAEPLVCGLIALLDGRATFETLWGDYIKPGEKYPVYPVDSRILTKTTYQSYLDEISDYLSQ